MSTENETYTYTNDHLVKAFDIISHQFWDVHQRVAESFDTRAQQLEAINELTRLGNAMVKINEARASLF